VNIKSPLISPQPVVSDVGTSGYQQHKTINPPSFPSSNFERALKFPLAFLVKIERAYRVARRRYDGYDLLNHAVIQMKMPPNAHVILLDD